MSRQFSSMNNRQDILWNIQDPGDPYDITKSMIQRLPGEQKVFMGNNLELVCLFQAAEIERLTQCLNDQMHKYRQMQKPKLDRHLYDEMIKELAQKLATVEKERNAHNETINKLKDFLQKQAKQMEDLKKYPKDQLQAKYEQALKQLDEYRRQNTFLKQQNTKHIQQIEQLRYQLAHAVESVHPRQTMEIQQIKSRYQSEIRSLDVECRRYKEENFSMRGRIEQLERAVVEAGSRDTGKDANLLSEKVYRLEGETVKLQNTISLLRQQIQRLTLVQRQKSTQILTLRDQLRIRQQEISRHRSESSSMSSRLQLQQTRVRQLQETMRGRMGQSTEQQHLVLANRKMQKTLADLSIEIERLNGVLRQKVAQNEQLERRLKEYEYEFSKTEILRRENETNRNRIEELSRKIVEYEGKVALFSQETERLTLELRKRVGEGQMGEEKYRQTIRENEELRSRISMIENRVGQDSRSYDELIQKLRRQNDDHRTRLESTTRKLSEYESKMALMSQQIQRLNMVLQRTVKQRDYLSQQMPQLSTIRSTYQSRVMNLTTQNQEYRRKITQLTQQVYRVEEYERKLTTLSMEVKRLNDVLSGKIEEIQSLSSMIRQREGENNMLKVQVRETGQAVVVIQQKETEIGTLRRQLQVANSQLRKEQDDNTTLRRTISELQATSREVAQLRQKLITLSDQIQRLNEILSKFKQQNDQLRNQSRSIPEYESRISIYESKTTTYQQQLQTITTQLHQSETTRRQLQSVLQQQSGNLQQKLFQAEQKCASLTIELQHRNRYIQEYEQRITQLSTKSREGEKTLNEYANKMMVMSKEIERLNDVVQRVSGQSQERLQRLQQFGGYEQQVEREQQEQKRRVTELENKTALLGQEVERLNAVIQAKLRDINTLTSQYNNTQRQLDQTRYKLQVSQNSKGDQQQRFTRSQQEITRLQQIIRQHQTQLTETTTKLSSYHQKLVMLSQENQRLGGGVQEVDVLRRKVGEYVRMEHEYQQLGVEHGELVKRVTDYQAKMALLSQEVQRLNEVLRAVTNQREQLTIRLQRLGETEQTLSSVTRENEGMNRTITQYENKVAVMRQEIERLEESVRGLKGEKEQLTHTTLHLQQQLTSLTSSRLPQYETRMSQLLQQIERLNGVLSKLTQQNNDLRNNSQSAVQKMSQELARLTGELTRVGQQRERVENLLRGVQNEKNELIARLQSWTRDGDRFNEEITSLRKQNADYEDQLRRMSQQIDRLTNLLTKSTQQNQQLSIKINQYIRIEQQLTTTSQDSQRRISEYQSKIALLSQQLQRLNTRYSDQYGQANTKIQDYARRQQQLSDQLGNVNRRLAEYENKLAVSRSEIQRLTEALEGKSREVATLGGQLSRDTEELRYKLRVSEQAYRELEGNYRQAMGEIDRLNRVVSDNTNTTTQFQDRAKQYLQQIQRLNNTLRIKVQQTKRWQIRCTQLQNLTQTSTTQWRHKCQQLDQVLAQQRTQLRTVQESYARLSAEYEKTRSSLKEYELMIRKLNQELDRLQEMIRVQKQKCEEFDRYKEGVGQHEREVQGQVKGMQEEIVRLTTLLHQHQAHIRQLTDRQSQQSDMKLRVLQQEVRRLTQILQKEGKHTQQLTYRVVQDNSLQKRIQQHLALFVVLFAEIEALRNRLIEKEVEVQDVRRSSLAPFMGGR